MFIPGYTRRYRPGPLKRLWWWITGRRQFYVAPVIEGEALRRALGGKHAD